VCIVIIAPGSRGDVQRYLALGLGLKRAGHAVVTTMDHDALLRGFDLELASAPFNVQEALQAKNVAASIEGVGWSSFFAS